MIVKILGGIDVIIGLILILLGAGMSISNGILIFCGVILIVKSLLGFFHDFASWVDLIGGIFLLISSVFHLPGLIAILIGIVIMQKGGFSFL